MISIPPLPPEDDGGLGIVPPFSPLPVKLDGLFLDEIGVIDTFGLTALMLI